MHEYFQFRSSNNEILYIIDIEKEPKNKVKALISFCQDLSKNTQKALDGYSYVWSVIKLGSNSFFVWLMEMDTKPPH